MRRTVVVALVAALAAGAAGTAVAAPSAADRKRVVVGTDGYLFIAQDWTVPCADAGTAAAAGTRIGQVASALRSSGRPTTVVIAPDKSTVRTGNVVASRVPSKACAERQKAALWAEAAKDPGFLDLRKPLSAAGSRYQTYWRKDTHWTPTSSGVYGQQLAKRLDPLLPPRLESTSATYHRRGDLATVLEQPADETVTGTRLVNPSTTTREAAPRDVGLVNDVRTTRTTASSLGRLVPGRTVFVGDSMDDVSVEQLAPLFAEAVFVWITPGEPLAPVLTELKGADRVVLESVERFGARSRMQEPDAVRAVRTLPKKQGSSLVG
ncbi:MAG: hypothetical protein JWN17_2422 [Frankiales bacterium]|nr:hypothetical protein [Frankiales bacterium]